MGKYGEAIGYWEHELNGIKHKLEPTEDDSLNFVRVQKEARNSNDENMLYKGIREIYVNMVKRAYPELTEEDVKELNKLVGQNIIEIINDMMIALKMTTTEKLARYETMQSKELEKYLAEKLREKDGKKETNESKKKGE